LAFGYEAQLATRLAYRQATADDWWIDEPKSPSYNRWVTGKPQVSAEAMRRDDDQYEVGCVIEWNTEAPVPGRGSAIFFHVWKEPAEATSGCVAVCESDARALLAWLDRAREPVFVICER
jgi:L,D-peptidoglycan transpeptidase YkuD (ErfK/YbiS/YcfS/YnhG family)